MRVPLVPMLILLLLQLLTDGYLFMVAWRRAAGRRLFWPKFQLWEAGFFLIYIVVFLCLPRRSESDGWLAVTMWMVFIYLTVYAGKIIFVIGDLLASLPLLWHGKRWKWMSAIGVVAAAAVFITMWWGALINRYHIQVNEVNVRVENLPQSFNGYKIVQLSDLHVGTLTGDTTFTHNLVERVNELHPDLIVFTGDIVNRHTAELPSQVATLSRLQSRDGVISILGNHDYGSYFDFPSPQAEEENREWLMDLQIEMGWELLTNTTAWIYGSNPSDSIAIVGVENWSNPPFPRYGSLEESYPTLGDSNVKILLTHDPAHWNAEVAPNDTVKIDLTLSGHTHAMQMEVGGWSPASWRTRTWGGLYNSPDGRRPLYVNIGCGTVGIPMRIGATPEITLITLLSK